METHTTTTISKKGGVEIALAITDKLGAEIKSTCIKGAWLLLTKTSDTSFAGEPLQHDGAGYILPEDQMLALGMSPGDTVLIVFSDVLETIIVKKISPDER